MSREPEEDGFLSRWSRRKRMGPEEEPKEVPAEEPPPPEEELTDEEILAKYNLPDPATLKPGDDFSVFMRAPIPHHLRRIALRKLWRSNPVLAVLDGLNDYDDDFTGDTYAKGTLKTAYAVGRGFLKEAADGGTLGDEAPLPGPEEGSEGEEDAGAISVEITEPSAATLVQTDPAEEAIDQDDIGSATPARRRMAFRFSDNE